MSNRSGVTRLPRQLTSKLISALKPETLPYRVPDQRCRGLAIRVAASGTKTWDLAYRIKGAGKVRRISLGAFHDPHGVSSSDVGLEAARRRADDITRAARAGRDLRAEEAKAKADAESAAAQQITIEQLIEEYLHRRVVGRLRTADAIERRLKRALAPMLTRAATELQRREIRKLLDTVADDGAKREAEKRRQAIGTMFRWALSQDIVEADPTAGLSAYDSGAPSDHVLTAQEIEKLWSWLLSDSRLPPAATDVLRFQLATGARCGEAGGICAEEVDLKHWKWTLPANRSKNKRARVTPLVGIARSIIEGRLAERRRGPLFTTRAGKPLTASYIGNALVHRRGKLPIRVFTTHDLRRTVTTMLAEMGVSLDLVAAVVGHETGGRQTRTLVRHYVHTDFLARKKAALEAWDKRLEEIIEGRAQGSNITDLAEARTA